MKRYRLRLLPPGESPLLTRLGYAMPRDLDGGTLAVTFPRNSLIWYQRYGTALKDAVAVATVARSFDLQLEHPIMLALGEKGWVDKLGAGMGYMMYEAMRGDDGYENLRAAIHAYPQEPTVDERGCVLYVNGRTDIIPTGGTSPPDFVHQLFSNASKVYGLHGEPLAPDQIRRALTSHVGIGPMMRRFYETPREETDTGSGSGVRPDGGGV